MKHHLYIGLGSNLGDRQGLLREAIRLIDLTVGHIVHVSSFRETEPWGFQSKHPFLNAVALVQTALSPLQCLVQTQHIEHQMGRTCKSTDGHYHDRTIDIDLLLYDQLEIDTPQLTLPHPHIQERDFVRIPLDEVMETDKKQYET